MATEYPPLNKIYVFGYSANDHDYPILSATADPRVAGYQVPKDLSACPDKRYPNHVFTGAQPISGDQRVRHVWEILPSPWIPFTRYDDDLGPVQGRRRSVKNERQVASLRADRRTTYEGRDGSAIVLTETEESWSIKTDANGNSPFPVKTRNFYDPSRGDVKETRQLIVPTGGETATLVNAVVPEPSQKNRTIQRDRIIQTTYEPYNQFLSFKIVQTYGVDGPLLIGKSTNNEGQLVTITTQRKNASGYRAPNPTATKTVEANSEDAASIVETTVDTPEIFKAQTYRKTREDLTPQKFKAAQEDSTVEENVAGNASPSITLGSGEFAKSEQQIDKFIKRISTTSRPTSQGATSLTESVLTSDGQIGTRTLTLASGLQTIIPSATTVDASVEALGDGRTVKTETKVPKVFANKIITKTKIDLTPEKFRAKQEDTTVEESAIGTVGASLTLGSAFRKSEEQVTEFVKRTSTTTRDIKESAQLKEYVVTPQGQLAERTLTLSSAGQAIEPSALLVDGSIEEIGDGRTIKTETKVSKIFDGKGITVSKEDNIPSKFKAGLTTKTKQEIKEQSEVDDSLNVADDEIEKSQQKLTDFTVREITISRKQDYEEIDNTRLEETWGISIPYTEAIENSVSSDENSETEGIGDGRYLVRKYNTNGISEKLSSFSAVFPTKINIDLPRRLVDIEVEYEERKSSGEQELDAEGLEGSFENLTQRDTGSVSSTLTIIPRFVIKTEEAWGRDLDAEVHIFFLKENELTKSRINSKAGASGNWPKFSPQSFSATGFGYSETKTISASISRAISFTSSGATGYQPTKESQVDISQASYAVPLDIPSCIREAMNVSISRTLTGESKTINLSYPTVSTTNGETLAGPNINKTLNHEIKIEQNIVIPATPNQTTIPKNGKYVMNSSVEPYKFGWYLVRATVLDASSIG